jgi:hypothetical protein
MPAAQKLAVLIQRNNPVNSNVREMLFLKYHPSPTLAGGGGDEKPQQAKKRI